MKNLVGCGCVFLVVAAFSFNLRAEESDLAAAIVHKKVASAHGRVSLSLRGADGIEIINEQGDRALAPASIAKAVSTSCSLNQLGPQFQFETLFLASGKVQGDTLEGDLVIQGNGDPSLIIEDMHEVIEKLRVVHGIRKITGDLVFDVSYLGAKSLAMSEGFEGDEGRSFAVEITPTAINQNSFSLWVTPDVRDRAKSRAVALPDRTTNVKVNNKTKTGTSTEVSVSYDVSNQSATIQGVIARDAEPKGIYRAVDDSYQYALQITHRLWLDSGGEWKQPSVKISTTPVKATLLWTNNSRPLAKILMDVNKFSLNLGAELIFLAAGAEKFGRPASYEKSLHLLNDCLKDKKIQADGIKLTNGSGLSREAAIKASVLSQFLFLAKDDFYWPEYVSSFGILGVDGTSKSRLKNFAGRARLKTGSLKDVRSIAGYIYGKDRKVYSFAMIQNGVSSAEAKALEDQVLEQILKTR